MGLHTGSICCGSPLLLCGCVSPGRFPCLSRCLAALSPLHLCSSHFHPSFTPLVMPRSTVGKTYQRLSCADRGATQTSLTLPAHLGAQASRAWAKVV
jgi:hypothetical protein